MEALDESGTRSSMKKRKGSEVHNCTKLMVSPANLECFWSNPRDHYSVEDYNRLKKKSKENDKGDNPATSFKIKVPAIVTAPPRVASPAVSSGRGLKRKIGCISVASQLSGKKSIKEDYIVGAAIGHGKFGSVNLCKSRVNGEQFACKTLKKGEENVHREVEIMQHLSGHPGVVTLKAVYEDLNCFHLVMELCSGGRLIDQMAKEGLYSEQRAATMLKELMLVIKYCHDMGVVHRDIKPENILLTSSGKMKLADFGLALRISSRGQNLSGLAGSPAYVAPEILTGNYCEKVDVWSAGVLLHALLTGDVPFKANSLEDVFEEIKKAQLDFHSDKWVLVSKSARDLLDKMLTRDTSARASAEDVLRHPWILFYTDPTLKTFYNAKQQSPVLLPCGFPTPTAVCEGQDKYGLVDALTVAVSHMKISAAKRSRICDSSRSIVEQHSSNLTSQLCKAF